MPAVNERNASILMVANSLAAVLHLGLAMSAIISTLDQGAVTVPVFNHKASWNATQCSVHGDSVPACPDNEIEKIGRVNFSAVLIISQLITCCFHVLQAYQSRSLYSNYVRLSLQKGIKIYHWVEYIATAPLIAHVVLYYSGIFDLRTVLIGYAAQSTLMLIGVLQDTLRHGVLRGFVEPMVAKVAVSIAFFVGFFNLATIWGPSLYALFVDSGDADPPEFVKWVVLAEAILYSSFGLSQLAFYAPFLAFPTSQYVERFLEEELSLIILSFVSKAVLASAFSVCLVYRQCN